MGKRIRIIAMLMTVLFAVVLVQAANVQFRQAKKLADSPNNPRNIEARLSQTRGDILAGDGSLLAQSIRTPHSTYKYKRIYPQGSLFGQITGFDSANYGLWGIESQYNSFLVSHKQPATSLSQLLNPTTTTDSVQLTVLPALQQLAASQLAGRNGAIAAINPVTGDVEAMYSNPNYDPNGLASPVAAVEQLTWAAAIQRNAAGYAPLTAMAFQTPFPPGSTFKVVTTSATYDHRPDLVNKSYPQKATISLPNSPQTLSNDNGGTCGGTIAEMLPPSCDTGYALLGMDLGAQVLWEQATAFGFDQRPPLDIPGVAISNFPTPAQLQNGLAYVAYSAIGQYNVRATALQNALDAAAIANAGVVMSPHLLKNIRDSQGNLVETYKDHPWLTATTPQTAASVSSLMQEVVKAGTASGVGFLPQDQVAAKTGTAQTGLTNVSTSTDDWMIAFAPASHPVIAIAVIIPDQAQSATGAEVAGPVMKCMIEGSLAAALNQPVTNTATTCPS